MSGILDMFKLGATTEAAEFAPGSYATADVSNHVPNPKVPITGGEKERPAGAPADHSIPVPGGLSEKPSGAPKDQGPSIPSKTEITDQKYVIALNALQKSLKESANVIDSITESLQSDKNKQLKESKEMKDLYKEYLADFVESGVDGSPLTIDQFTEAVAQYNETGEVESYAEGVAATYRKEMKKYNKDLPDGMKKKPMRNKDIYGFVHSFRKDLHELHKEYNEARKARGEKPVSWTTFKGIKIAELDMEDIYDAAAMKESADVMDHLSSFLG